MPAAVSVAAAALLKQAGGEIESIIRGGSMHPALPDGTRIRVRCGGADLARGAIARGAIVAVQAEPLVIHRVAGCVRGRGGRFVITRGDALWHCDLPVAPDRILGTVTQHDPGSGWRPAPPAAPRTGLARLLAPLSYWLVRTALLINERVASMVVLAGGRAAARLTRLRRAAG